MLNSMLRTRQSRTRFFLAIVIDRNQKEASASSTRKTILAIRFFYCFSTRIEDCMISKKNRREPLIKIICQGNRVEKISAACLLFSSTDHSTTTISLMCGTQGRVCHFYFEILIINIIIPHCNTGKSMTCSVARFLQSYQTLRCTVFLRVTRFGSVSGYGQFGCTQFGG